MGDILNHSFGRRIGNCSVRAAVTNPSPSRSPREVCVCSSLSLSLSPAEDGDSRVLGAATAQILALLCSALADHCFHPPGSPGLTQSWYF